LSFAVIREADGVIEGFECRLNEETWPAFYASLRRAIDPKNKHALEAIRDQSERVVH
jgi:hypothetical protein